MTAHYRVHFLLIGAIFAMLAGGMTPARAESDLERDDWRYDLQLCGGESDERGECRRAGR